MRTGNRNINSFRFFAQFRWAAVVASLLLTGCGGGGGSASPPASPPPPPPPAVSIDDQLRNIINAEGLTGDPTAGRTLPSIDDPLAQLGKKLFFSKSLSGELDTACASCHHPALGGGDALSLPIGAGALDPDVIGPGRARSDNLPNVGRHSQSVFNVGLLDVGHFWDSRVESIGKEAGQNGSGSGIRTPDTALNTEDPLAGSTLPAAQARFPVTVPEEMLGGLMPGADGEAIRNRLAARIGDYGAGQGELANNNWLAEFQTAFASAETAEQLITFENIALAIAEYERSMVFVDTPWKSYIEGDLNAIEDLAKRGALLFFRNADEDGLECARCHAGDFFTDEEHTVVGFPQLGPGKGDGANATEDFGREQQTADANERFEMRTPTLLNIEVTGPYTHSGVFESLSDVAGHYVVPDTIFDDFMQAGSICSLDQFSANPDCATLFPNFVVNSEAALAQVLQQRLVDPDNTFPDLTDRPIGDDPLLQAFLRTLTDPCVMDRACLAPWIPLPAESPDDHQLNAVDANGNPL